MQTHRVVKQGAFFLLGNNIAVDPRLIAFCLFVDWLKT